MAKKKQRAKYVSKGERPPITRKVLNAYRRDRFTELEVAINKLDQWKAGKNPWITIPNPNTSETNKPFIRIRANEYYGDFRQQPYMYKPRLEVV